MRRFFGGELFRLDHQFGVGRLFVGVGDAGELLDDPGAGLGVEALAVPGLALLERRRDVGEDEAAAFLSSSTGRSVAESDSAVLPSASRVIVITVAGSWSTASS